MHAPHKHDHAHPHHAKQTSHHILAFCVVITLAFAIIEFFGGWLSGSLTLLSDAGHMVSDTLGLMLAAFAAWIAKKPPSTQHSYGLGRAEVIAAWLSSIFMLAVSIAIVIEAIQRFREPTPVAGHIVIIIAVLGLIVNIFIAWLLSRGEKTLNTRAALIHVMGDLLGSVAAIISGTVIYYTNWTPIDPILSIFICVLILISSMRILRESLMILMEGVPHHIELKAVGNAMAKIDNVNSVHDLHIWTLSSGSIALSAHIRIDDLTRWSSILNALQTILMEQYSITHITLQPEPESQVVTFQQTH